MGDLNHLLSEGCNPIRSFRKVSQIYYRIEERTE